MADFFLYELYNATYQEKYLGERKTARLLNDFAIKIIEYYRKPMKAALEKSKRFIPPNEIRELGAMAEPVVSLCNQTGEGWFLTAEIIELITEGVNNVICMQPFACLPNHVTGKGIIKEIKRRYALSNIVAIDYDPGASEVNQLNRIKLMLNAAEKNLKIEKNMNNVEKLRAVQIK